MEERKRERKRISPFTCLLFCFVNFFDLFQTRLSPFFFSPRSIPDHSAQPPFSFFPLSSFTFFFRLWTRSTLFLSYRYRKRKKSISLIPRSSCFNMEGNTKVVTLFPRNRFKSRETFVSIYRFVIIVTSDSFKNLSISYSRFHFFPPFFSSWNLKVIVLY